MLKYIHQLTRSFLHKQPQFWGQALSCSKTRITPKCKCMFKWLFRGNTFISTLNIDGISSFWENCLKFLAKFEASHLSNLVAYKKSNVYICFVLNPDFMFLFSLAQTDARVASESASDANEDLQKFIAENQWEKVEETSSRLLMAITRNKRAADQLEDLQSKRKKLASKK